MVLPFPFTFWKSVSTSAGANPQLLFFENQPCKQGSGNQAISFLSDLILRVHAVNIPLSLSFNYPVVMVTHSSTGGSRSLSISFGLYSLNGSTLSLANSASRQDTFANASREQRWVSLITSATQNITPGSWYFALVCATAGDTKWNLIGNSAPNCGNAMPVFGMGRMTNTTNAIPNSIATSDLDITGQDATTQPYIIITS